MPCLWDIPKQLRDWSCRPEWVVRIGQASVLQYKDFWIDCDVKSKINIMKLSTVCYGPWISKVNAFGILKPASRMEEIFWLMYLKCSMIRWDLGEIWSSCKWCHLECEFFFLFLYLIFHSIDFFLKLVSLSFKIPVNSIKANVKGFVIHFWWWDREFFSGSYESERNTERESSFLRSIQKISHDFCPN